MIHKLVLEICNITKNLEGIVSKKMILKEFLNSENITDYQFIDRYRDKDYFSLNLFKEEFLFLDTSNETMTPTKQDYYYQTIDNRCYQNHIPFLIIYNNKVFMFVINQEGDLKEFYQTKEELELPDSHYIVNNGTTFVDYNNYGKIEFRLISENPDSTSYEDRNYQVKQVTALNIIKQFKFLYF